MRSRGARKMKKEIGRGEKKARERHERREETEE